MIKRIIKVMLGWLDRKLTSFLQNNSSLLPDRWIKFIAMFYPDARIRKIYWARRGISMGEGTYANFGFTVAKEQSKVVIGNNVSIAPGVIVITDSVPNNSALMKEIPYIKENLIRERDVYIEDDVWIGAGAIIFPGVVVGRGAVIGAGSIVRENVPPFSIVAGSPAKVIRYLKKGL